MNERANSIAIGLLLVLSFAAGWAVNGWRADAHMARAETAQAKQDVTQAQQSQAATEIKATAVVEHGTAQQENTHDYTQELARLEAGRAADAVRIAGLQHDIRGAATRNAQLAGDAAACRDLADQHQRLAAIAAEGASLVGDLSGLVQKRDAQVNLLSGQISVDRTLLEQLN
ncbi:hypothetical protein SR914_25270 [Comamonas testosteroni]|uniref:Uncharacterized protein n=1 Tax=Comamonas testosteroni (strain DSM 14576 / KF-1) TaxID=399795 RepID=B7X0Z4_COMTK|nr:hypothetical protein [Comamonas testosteroni]EED68325.1 hypothetical protein CtesDRAFT_PD3272 [Comamonas testosteroni KF-1]EED68388.1 hypothetical protein CtesDRAFT_PD3335 [Comamonas testosteroni KF-1]WQG66420.1 hypothetical protein SR914_25270 [Comamonas testosteroni]